MQSRWIPPVTPMTQEVPIRPEFPTANPFEAVNGGVPLGACVAKLATAEGALVVSSIVDADVRAVMTRAHSTQKK